MGLFGNTSILTVPKIIGGFLIMFLTTIMVYITQPIAQAILGLNWTGGGMMKVAATLSMWLIYYFVIWNLTWRVIFTREQEGEMETVKQ